MNYRTATRRTAWGLASLAVLMMSTACARVPEAASETASAAQAAAPVDAADTTPVMIVHKSPSCGCCGLWVEHMQRAGFNVEVRNTDDIGPIKARLGVPYGKGSCHTAEIDGYLVEGHVPADLILKMLKERPAGRGLAVPGMPIGSPGMEGGTPERYQVLLFDKAGTTRVYATR